MNLSGNFRKKNVFLFAVFATLTSLAIGILLLPGVCNAKTFYLDNKAGIVNGSSTYDPATRTVGSGSAKVYTSPWDAGQALASGDTLYIRQGTYWATAPGGGTGADWQLGSLTIPAATSGATVSGYNNEIVWLSCGSSLTTVAGSPNNALKIDGTNNTVKNISIWGCVILTGIGNVIDNCNVSGGWDHQSTIGGDAWYDVIRMAGGINNTVRNCSIHDNYDHGTVTGSENKSLIMHDHDENSVFENNNFYNPVKGFVYVKYGGSGAVQTTYRYNWFQGGNGTPFTGISYFYTSQEIRFYQNIITNSGNYWFPNGSMGSLTFKVYNNTFYNVTGALQSWTGPTDAHEFFNNIVVGNGATSFAIYYDGPNFTGYSNYNNFYGLNAGDVRWHIIATTYSPLSSWQSVSGKDTNSVTTNPNFVNASGLFNQPSDFKRTTYPANGRGGVYTTVMGAYTSDNVIVGVGSGSLPPPPPPTAPPAPQNPSASGGDGTVTLQWAPVSGATSYNLYWSMSPGITPGNGTRIANVTSPYVHRNLTNGTTYYYVITAVNSVGESNPSAAVSAAPAAVVGKIPSPATALYVK